MNFVMVILRLIHVLAGVFWAGATFVLASHITPTVKATGDSGKTFMGYLGGKGNISGGLALSGTLTLISGLLMYGIQGWDRQFNTLTGFTLFVGVIIGTFAYFHGLFVQRKAITTFQGLAAEVAASGGPPSPEQAAQMNKLSAKTEKNGILLAYMLAVTVILMAIFPYV